MQDLITIEVIKSFAGATATVVTITEFVKKTAMLIAPKKKLPDIAQILIALATSVSITVGTTILSGIVSVMSIILAVVNGLAVFASATGSYRAAKSRNPKI
jgi:hypothetical protein